MKTKNCWWQIIIIKEDVFVHEVRDFSFLFVLVIDKMPHKQS